MLQRLNLSLVSVDWTRFQMKLGVKICEKNLKHKQGRPQGGHLPPWKLRCQVFFMLRIEK